MPETKDIVWEKEKQRVLSGPQDQSIIEATARCFAACTEETLGALEAVLASEPEVLMRQCVLVVQSANDILDAEGRQLATIFAQQGKPIVCGPGCSRCCRQLVLCRPFEARLIKACLEAQAGDMQSFAQAYARWDKATSPYRESYLAWAEKLYGKGEDDGSHCLEDFQQDCPFLDEVGRCSIYPVRPYACRTCIALDPACPAPPPERREALHMQYSLYTTHHATRQAITELLLRRLGGDARSVPMPQLVAALCL